MSHVFFTVCLKGSDYCTKKRYILQNTESTRETPVMGTGVKKLILI